MGLIKKNSGTGTVSSDWNDITNKPALDMAGLYSSFSHTNTFPRLLGNVTTELNISKIILNIKTPFNDPNTTITIGDLANPSKFMTSNDNDPNSINKYTVEPDFKYNIGTDVYLFITGTNIQGEGFVDIYLD